MDEQTLERVENKRLELENNIAKLRKSLQHWQTLELDYDVLKDEFLPLSENASAESCSQAVKESGVELIDEKEVQELLGDGKGGHRRPSQIVDLLTKRGEYVARNISTLRTQLSDAEKKRNALLLAENLDLREDAGLPLAEITEELNDEGEVISRKVDNPGRQTSQLAHVLQKAGVKGVENDDVVDEKEDTHNNGVDAPTKTEPGELPVQADGDTSHLDSTTEPDGNSTAILSESDSQKSLLPTNPQDSEEDAKLRQEMLQYGLDEVVPIVAELEVGDDAEDLSDDEEDFDDEDYSEDDDEEDESEDESGRTKSPMISNSYRRKMEELEKSLGLKDMKNLGPTPELPQGVQEQLDRPSAAEAARKAAIEREEAARKQIESDETESNKNEGGKIQKKTKKVAFAPTLDIAGDDNEPPAVKPPAVADLPERPRVKPIGEAVVERSSETNSTAPSAPQPKKVSKFKAARSEQPQTPMFPPPMEFPSSETKPTPEGPPGQTIANSIVERDGAKNEEGASAPNGDDFDDEAHKREVAAEYYKMRNRKIHEQGGYVGAGEQDNYGDDIASSFVEGEESGKRRKVSRFKAARMKQ